MLRRAILILAVSTLEFLLAELLRRHYVLHPRALPADAVKFTLEELRTLGSIPAAETEILDDAIEKFLHLRFDKQFKALQDTLGLDTTIPTCIASVVVETVQRRHLCVHADGVVSDRYLRLVSKELVAKHEAVLDKPLYISNAYLKECLDAVLALGVSVGLDAALAAKLTSPEDALSWFCTEVVFRSLVCEKYTRVISLCSLADSWRITNWANEQGTWIRTIRINKAIAQRKSGDAEGCITTLDTMAWVDCSLRFKVAEAILREEPHGYIRRLMDKAIAAEDISKNDLRSWPLFDSIRTCDEFASLFGQDVEPSAVSGADESEGCDE